LKLPYEIKRLGSWRCIELFFKKYSYFDLTQMARQWPVCMEKNYMSHEKQFTSHAFLDIKSTFFFYIDQTANPLSFSLLHYRAMSCTHLGAFCLISRVIHKLFRWIYFFNHMIFFLWKYFSTPMLFLLSLTNIFINITYHM
jgi:hypothetical protein